MNEPLIGWKPFGESPKIASARIRCRGPLALLRAAGIPVELYRHENERRYRVVILQKLYDLAHLELARRLREHGTRVVFDLCDNHLYNPTGDPKYAEQEVWLREMRDTAAMVIDHLGWLGVEKSPINAWKVFGAVLLAAGALLMQKK